MSLFQTLLAFSPNSQPTEDFFTEVVAHFFRCNNTLLIEWLHDLSDGHMHQDLQPSLSTQCTYKALKGHISDSRPDMKIELSDGENRDIILLESKIASKEGLDQLKRYSEQLINLSGYRHRYLIYITRDYEKKNIEMLPLGTGSTAVRFIQVRWHHFYQFIEQYPKTALVSEIKSFMETHHMSQGKHFSSLDLVAMMNFKRTIGLMEACLEGQVKEKFDKVLENKNSCQTKAMIEFKHHGRFMLYKIFQKHKLSFHIGFIGMNDKQIAPYPDLTVRFEVSPDFQEREEILEWMKGVTEITNTPWQGINLDNANAWAKIHITKNMQEVLSEINHVTAIQDFFIQGLETVEKLVENSTELPSQLK